MAPEKRIEQVGNSIERAARGLWHELSLSRCCDYLEWLYKYHPELRAKVNPLIDRVIEVMTFGNVDVFGNC